MKETESNGYQILSNGKTVWVNGPDGCSAGRFSPIGGIDIHKSFEEQVKDLGDPCLDCKPGPCDVSDWQYFVDGMKKYYNVEVGDEHRPQVFPSAADLVIAPS